MPDQLQPLYPPHHARSIALLKRYDADWLMEAEYAGLMEVPDVANRIERLVMVEKFMVVRLIAGPPRESKGPGEWMFAPWDEDQQLVAGRRYWLAAKAGQHWRVV